VSIAECHGIEVDCLAAEWGTAVSAAQLQERLRGGQYAAVTFTHVDTSTGVAAPVEELVRVAGESGTLVILDSVCALGGMPLEMERWGVDVVLTGAQKALGVPPGLALLLVSERAMNRRRALQRVPTFYADLANWETSMSDPQIYFSTHAVNLFYALQAAIEIVRKEGLELRFDRHDRLSRAFRAGMSAYGFTSLTNEDVLAPTLSVLAYPAGVEDAAFRERLAAHGVVAAGCLGPFKGKGARFGHMGNISETEIFQTLLAVGRTLESLGVSSGSAEAIQRALSI
jgi:aspartate aminotransferase-like enzyme